MKLMTLNPGTGNCGDHMVMAVAGDHELSGGGHLPKGRYIGPDILIIGQKELKAT